MFERGVKRQQCLGELTADIGQCCFHINPEAVPSKCNQASVLGRIRDQERHGKQPWLSATNRLNLHHDVFSPVSCTLLWVCHSEQHLTCLLLKKNKIKMINIFHSSCQGLRPPGGERNSRLKWSGLSFLSTVMQELPVCFALSFLWKGTVSF